jgi:hypothetical protein
MDGVISKQLSKSSYHVVSPRELPLIPDVRQQLAQFAGEKAPAAITSIAERSG